VTRLPKFPHVQWASALLLLSAFGASPARCQESAPPAGNAAQKSAEARENQPEVPAQIELLETRVRFESDGESRKEVHTRVHINNELGAHQFARLAFDYNRSFQQIEFPLVRVTHSGGGTADILPSAISDQPNPAVANAPAYQDVRVKSVRILGLAPGDILEYRVLTTTSHHPLAPDFWLDHTFERSGLVSQETFELDLPGHLNSTATMGNWHGSPPVIVYLTFPQTSFRYEPSEGGTGRSIYQWEIPATRKLPAPVDDNGLPAPDVLVSSFPDWYKLAIRLAPHFSDWTEDDRKEAQTKLHSLAPHAKTPDDMLRASYDFVSKKLATVDLPLGATGFQLRRAKEIFDSGYATPEEKCCLLAQFARLAGINAEIVFAAPPETQKQFGRPSALSRVFVAVSEKKKRLALDPSVEVAPFGLIPSEFRGKSTLSLTLGDAGDYSFASWPPLPTELPFPASQRVAVDATLAADGGLEAKVHYSMRGENELLLRVAFHQSPRDKWKEVAQLLALSDGFRGKITNVSASDPYATNVPFTVEYEIMQPKFVDWSKQPVRIPALLPQVGLPDPPAKTASAAATSPIDLGTPLDVETHLTLRLPTRTTARTPTGTAVDRDYATFASKYEASKDSVTASRHLNFLLRQIPADRAGDYNAFVRAVQSDEAQEFILERTQTATPATANPTLSEQSSKPKPRAVPRGTGCF
jgi:Domain of Unknown Function with PDB structure (DUF3857)